MLGEKNYIISIFFHIQDVLESRSEVEKYFWNFCFIYHLIKKNSFPTFQLSSVSLLKHSNLHIIIYAPLKKYFFLEFLFGVPLFVTKTVFRLISPINSGVGAH